MDREKRRRDSTPRKQRVGPRNKQQHYLPTHTNTSDETVTRKPEGNARRKEKRESTTDSTQPSECRVPSIYLDPLSLSTPESKQVPSRPVERDRCSLLQPAPRAIHTGNFNPGLASSSDQRPSLNTTPLQTERRQPDGAVSTNQAPVDPARIDDYLSPIAVCVMRRVRFSGMWERIGRSTDRVGSVRRR